MGRHLVGHEQRPGTGRRIVSERRGQQGPEQRRLASRARAHVEPGAGDVGRVRSETRGSGRRKRHELAAFVLHAGPSGTHRRQRGRVSAGQPERRRRPGPLPRDAEPDGVGLRPQRLAVDQAGPVRRSASQASRSRSAIPRSTAFANWAGPAPTAWRASATVWETAACAGTRIPSS